MNSSSCSAFACMETEALLKDLFSSIKDLIRSLRVSISIFRTRFSCSKRSMDDIDGECDTGGGDGATKPLFIEDMDDIELVCNSQILSDESVIIEEELTQ